MSILRPTKIIGRVEAIAINRDPHTDLSTERVSHITVSYAGFEGEAHSGLTRPSCVRVRRQYVEGTEIRNTRQVSIVSIEDLAQISEAMGVPHLEPEWLGANLCVSGIPDFTLVPPSSRLIFSGGASLVVDMENEPCKYPGMIIDKHIPGAGERFAKSAINLRGITAWVEREGMINDGDDVTLHVPPQRIYDFRQEG